MAQIYKISSTKKLLQMEKELSVQLFLLKTEIEENGILGGTPFYSSVSIPKDISYFRLEREQVLKKGLQVPRARHLISQAVVMQRELESCLNREYTPESLPLLLHQFYADRCYYLALCKYLHMLRWRRFCRHASVIEMLYPSYKRQLANLMSEYEDSTQRAQRLAPSREKVLLGKGSPINMVTLEDLAIYLQWLVCNLHSVKTVHGFLRELQYLPAGEWEHQDSPGSPLAGGTPVRKDSASAVPQVSGTRPSLSCERDGVSELPRFMAKLENFSSQLQELISHFNIKYNIADMRTGADEMELFDMVRNEFKTVFGKQEAMWTFVRYGSTEALEKQWGRMDPNMTLKKKATWIPFIKVTPRLDPWQQKLMTKLRQQCHKDELLDMLNKLLKASDSLLVAETLKDYAASSYDLAPDQPSPMTSCRTSRSSTHIWAMIYRSTRALQESNQRDSDSFENGDCREKTVDGAKRSTALTNPGVDSMQLLSLAEGQLKCRKDPVFSRGAFLSFLYLRYLKVRELQRSCLGMLNYLRSVERTLAYDAVVLREEPGKQSSNVEMSSLMSASRGGSGLAGALGSHHYLYSTPADYTVHCAEVMDLPDVENLHDFYSSEEEMLHTQDHCGLYIVYDVALNDLRQLENTVLQVASHYIQNRANSSALQSCDLLSWAQADVDRLAVLLDLWKCEADFLRSKIHLMDCYFEAYQHVVDPEERVKLAQVITDIMHRRPQMDLDDGYFVKTYRAELACLRSHQKLIKAVLDCQIDECRQYLQRIWRDGEKGTWYEHGLPLNYIPKQLVSISNSRSALKSIFLLEFHPSLCLATHVYQTLRQLCTDFSQLDRTPGVHQKLALELQVLRRALQRWDARLPPGAAYNPQIQRDLFSGVFFEDPFFVRDVGLSVVESAGREEETGKERQLFVVETFGKLLELVTLRHRLIESATETASLSQLYERFALLMGFGKFHLYMRPVPFETAVLREKPEKVPECITALPRDDSSVDRYIPSSLVLAVQEVDENHIGKFSFYTEEAVVHLMSTSGIENLQVALACQVTQKNALIGAVKQACLCDWVQRTVGAREREDTPTTEVETSGRGEAEVGLESRSQHKTRQDLGTMQRLAGSFVSIQLEKTVLRDKMLDAFLRNKEVMGSVMRNLDEVAKLKRRLILEFCQRFGMRVSQSCVRGQIVGLYHSLNAILIDLPTIRQSYFTVGRGNEGKSDQDSEHGVQADVRHVLSEDGKKLLNLWYIPDFSEALTMFKSMDDVFATKALQLNLDMVSALHDIVSYLVGFAHLGNLSVGVSGGRRHAPLAADWGGTEGIGAELADLQGRIAALPDPCCPQAVARLLCLRRELLFLQFDMAVRHCIREALLSSGNCADCQTVTDNMGHALSVLSDSVSVSTCGLQLCVPRALEPRCMQTERLYPWRGFIGRHGLFPVTICDISPIEQCMQLCLSGLSDRGRTAANGEMLAVSLLLEDVLSSGQAVTPFCMESDSEDRPHSEDTEGCADQEADTGTRSMGTPSGPRRDPLHDYTTRKAFLLLWKQLEGFKEDWGRRQLSVEQINTTSLYRKYSSLYREEILYPSMRTLVRQLGSEEEFGSVWAEGQPVPLPTGASEVDIKTQQLGRLLECAECDLIAAAQSRIRRELTLVISERAHLSGGLPTELWKRPSMKQCFSPERPQIVENFMQQLMDGCEETEGKLTLAKSHLQECLTALGCAVMGRERSNFQAYSLFYENLLQHVTQMLFQREQDLKVFEDLQKHQKTSEQALPLSRFAELTRRTMLEMTALRARLARAEQNSGGLQERLNSQDRQRYDALVQHLISCCCQLKSRLDECHVRMDRDMTQLVTRVRREGVESINKLKRKPGTTEDDGALQTTLKGHEEQQDLWEENGHLAGLLCKLKTLHRWRQVAIQGKLQRQLHQFQQDALLYQREGQQVKMMAEEEVALLKQEVESVRAALEQDREAHDDATEQLHSLRQRLQAAEQQLAQQALGQRRLEGARLLSLERLQRDVGDRQQQLEELDAQLQRSSRAKQWQQLRSQKEIRQVRAQLLQERRLKLDAFRRVQGLRNQLSDTEAAEHRGGPHSGQNRTPFSRMTLSTQSTSAGSVERLKPATRPTSHSVRRGAQGRVDVDPGSNSLSVLLQRPKTGPSRLRTQPPVDPPPRIGSSKLLSQLKLNKGCGNRW
ncbi:uncharacterized protein si:ch73-242m19.1 [Brienomyrus brachyistius]|uniref:uncharacterized protein si:ch73-242m19.1 n=1 Tax=Brienomyrus brachyistius TaxID=42636 RepID=UPI0020B37824|nr:uncharacterized protein si:ch73-242m19.1 [Brienomyrus brachyistius]